ncbi:glycosyl transferase family 28 [Leptospira fletcheri]|uniref:Glycosyl transferase family 28 n=1 Tax=Leptospira fletcheri TaxID=2484981 RepID=A0A4R9GDM9_9LEPT|nr:glycosyltransferase [Leptospira fletcheri]TGK09958.1 glycosyl transferase family 28 [Leptospira fletcheri]
MFATFLTEGTSQTGYGHLARVKALYQAAESLRLECLFVCDSDRGGASYLEGINSAICDWKVSIPGKVADFLKRTNIIIFDSYLADREVFSRVKSISNIGAKLAYIDDFARLNYPDGIIINYSIGSDLELYQGQSGKKSYLLGPKYALLSQEYWENSSSYECSKEIQNILLTFGGVDRENLTERISDSLTREFPDLSLSLIIGSGNSVFRADHFKDKNVSVYSGISASKMKELFQKTDLCITAGGHTTYEIASVGTPMIVIATAENQKINTRGWGLLGVPTMHGGEVGLLEKISASIRIYKSYEKRISQRSCLHQTVNAKGAVRVMESLAFE